MNRVCAETRFLSKANCESIRRACADCGYDLRFYRSSGDADDRITECEILYCSTPALLPQMRNLRWCHSTSAGVGGFLAGGRFDSGEILLTNSSGAYGRVISEHILMVSLMLLRRYPEYHAVTEARQWKRNLAIRSIAGSRIAIVGTGDLGRSAAQKYRALGAASIIGFNRRGRPAEFFDRTCRMTEFCEQVGDVDLVVLCVPGTPQTEHLLNAECIAALPEKAFLINVGRGSSLDQDALIRALNEGRLAGAALDVVTPEPLPADHPLWTTRNCLITPHCSGDMGLPYTIDKTVEFFCRNLRHYAAGEPLLNLVDPQAGY